MKEEATSRCLRIDAVMQASETDIAATEFLNEFDETSHRTHETIKSPDDDVSPLRRCERASMSPGRSFRDAARFVREDLLTAGVRERIALQVDILLVDTRAYPMALLPGAKSYVKQIVR
jgi:hypothetical protein